jgi:hypothetical protein
MPSNDGRIIADLEGIINAASSAVKHARSMFCINWK